jgi:ABC-type bacteriocin/lantibiotic exporter with double-glycine peptidase domain
MEQDKIAVVLAKFVRQLEIPLTRLSIENELLKHPDYPSLFAVSDVLKNWKIANAAYKIPFKELDNVPCPYIACFHNGNFVVVTSFNKGHVTISDDNRTDHKMGTEDFKAYYSDTILAAEADAESGEKEYKRNRRKEKADALRIPFIIVSLLLIIFCLLANSRYFEALTFSMGWITLCKTLGTTIAVMLLMQSVDSDNPFLQRLCRGQDNDCNGILSSGAAKITEELSWSDSRRDGPRLSWPGA